MNTNKYIFSLLALLMAINIWSQKKSDTKIDSRIDNWRYWEEKAKLGVIPFNSNEKPKKAIFLNKTNSAGDTADIVLISGNGISQSENSVFVNPVDNQISLNSNNSINTSPLSIYGANVLLSFDGGSSWDGGVSGVAGENKGDPATAIGLNGTSYIGYINTDGGQGVAISTNNGTTWQANTIANGSSGFLDKNHLWIDNSNTSPFEGNIYSAWTRFSSGNNIEISHSTNNGANWSTPIPISNAVSAGSHNQGVNVQTGPNGEVYAVWSIYDNWPSEENAIGFSSSMDGGNTFNQAIRIQNNIKGIRWQPGAFPSNPHGKNMRTNSFPSMAVDISGGNNSGTIYVVWSNIGTPGINSGSDISIYLIKSVDNGQTWSAPTRINQDSIGNVQYFPWITCDPITGAVSVIFYDDRNTSDTNLEVWVANSIDGGTTWDDFRVSDVSFTPSPIPGLAGGYMGDYLGISARNGLVYPVWTDNRSGDALAYTSPYTLSSGCVSDLFITENVNPGDIDIQEAESTITASNIIFSKGTGNYKAGNKIILKSGFNAIEGSFFTAKIGGCSESKSSKINKINKKLIKASKPRTVEYFNENDLDNKLKIYPNPTKNIFNIELIRDKLDDFSIEIYSMSRGLVYSNEFNENLIKSFKVDISQFPDGLYYIKLINTNNKTVYTGKVIKH